MRKEFIKELEELIKTTKAKEDYEVEYMLLEAQKLFSAEVNGLGNQTQRDAQLKLLLKDEYRK
jgi:hypothetical protein